MMRMADEPIINTFQQRRALEQAIGALAETASEADLVEAVRALKFAYPTELLLPALLKRLDTPSSQLRGGLARLAALLPPEEAAPALRRYVGDRRNPPTARTTAAMILDRFLGDPAPPALTADLRESDDAAFQSLAEAVADARANPHVLLEYVTQMQPYGEEIALLVLHHLDRLDGDDRVALLRLMAQDARPIVARAALGRLDTLAASGNALAARALYTLQWATAPDIAALAERGSPQAPVPWQRLSRGGRRRHTCVACPCRNQRRPVAAAGAARRPANGCQPSLAGRLSPSFGLWHSRQLLRRGGRDAAAA